MHNQNDTAVVVVRGFCCFQYLVRILIALVHDVTFFVSLSVVCHGECRRSSMDCLTRELETFNCPLTWFEDPIGALVETRVCGSY